ncbi:CLUMA_CG021098, isoform A [Clunio marinus]|uniref:CLUMA_CG021098, isoform A n=1 Tax=Clunio marinus TaxID=568069 RepID=A0A1J1J6L2_9DIPT|nr:CLUMA_CG021098, isoform A [Clunio marinus]
MSKGNVYGRNRLFLFPHRFQSSSRKTARSLHSVQKMSFSVSSLASYVFGTASGTKLLTIENFSYQNLIRSAYGTN